jgi:hypothetical protein
MKQVEIGLIIIAIEGSPDKFAGGFLGIGGFFIGGFVAAGKNENGKQGDDKSFHADHFAANVSKSAQRILSGRAGKREGATNSALFL